MTHTEQLAYCAGLFDGEGSISIKKFVERRHRSDGTAYTRLRYELEIQVNQVRPEAIEILEQTFGGRVYFQSRSNGTSKTTGKPYSGRWFWAMDSRKAAACLAQLLPFLRLKQPEAELAIQFQGTKLQHGTGRSFKHGRTAEEIARHEAMYQEMARLKLIHNDPLIQEHYASLSHSC